jgi:hypothetical protein
MEGLDVGRRPRDRHTGLKQALAQTLEQTPDIAVPGAIAD